MSRAENAYIGRANITRRILRVDGGALTEEQKDAITKVQVHLGPHCLDTTEPADPITYDDGVVDLRIGLIPGLEEGMLTARMIVFDAETPQGKAWGSFRVRVLPWEACGE